MAVPTTMVIGPAEHLPALRARGVAGETSAFEDTDALGALDAITDQCPDVVLIERGFADTSRGVALIRRIEADPALVTCNIRVVAADGRDTPPSGRAPASSEKLASPAAAPAAAPVTAFATSVPPAMVTLDRRGTRRAPRAEMPEGIAVQIDGNTVTLVDLSVIGAQVISSTSLKPGQRVRFTLPDPKHAMRCRAEVTWAAFEIPKGAARYRAGIEFVDPNQKVVAGFIQAHGRDAT